MAQKSPLILAFALFTLGAICIFSPLVHAQSLLDPNDPFDFGFDNAPDEDRVADEEKSAEQLLQEAQFLFMDERPLDARSKLLLALKKDPENYDIHRLLAGYYMVHVGHYRLALQYIKKAMRLFEKNRGKPPYMDVPSRAEHAQLLYFLSQIRLNLDNYQGSLDTLDEFASYGYYQEWYPGTRAWTLMKLGRVEDAIKVARLGVLQDAERGRTLNILGILLSVTNQREASLAVFRQALEYELSLGDEGQPATPLNNSGEVFREIFREEEAERAWQRATSLPDGCEHILPFFNLLILSIEKGDLSAGKQAIDNFESCIAQFPLRNGEEHRAFVHLARGRLDMHSGHLPEAIDHLEQALDKRQWFGKIGTSEDDLRAAAGISLGQALTQQANILSMRSSNGIWDALQTRFDILELRLRSWWIYRRTKELMVEKLNDIEDLYVRHSDSMIEYPSMGDFLSSFPLSALEKRIASEKKKDDRANADLYYDAYIAQAELEHGDTAIAQKLLSKLNEQARPKYDKALLIHILSLRLHSYDTHEKIYQNLAQKLFLFNRARLRNEGLPLPVKLDASNAELREALFSGPFVEAGDAAEFSLRQTFQNGKWKLELLSRSGLIAPISAEGPDMIPLVNLFADKVFTLELGN